METLRCDCYVQRSFAIFEATKLIITLCPHKKTKKKRNCDVLSITPKLPTGYQTGSNRPAILGDKAANFPNLYVSEKMLGAISYDFTCSGIKCHMSVLCLLYFR